MLVGKAKLNAYMLKLQTVNKLSVAQEIRDQTMKEAQDVSTALIAAEQRIGELLLAIPKATTNHKGENLEIPDARNFKKSKSETISGLGYSKNEASDYQRMAKNPEVVQRVIADAIARGEVVSKAQVMKEIKAARDEAKIVTRVITSEPDDYKEAIAEARKLNKELSQAEARKRELEDELEELREINVPDELKRCQELLDEKESDIIQVSQELDRLRDKSELSGVVYNLRAVCDGFIRNVMPIDWISDKSGDISPVDLARLRMSVNDVLTWASGFLDAIKEDQ